MKTPIRRVSIVVAFIVPLFCLALTTCDQEALFWDIAHEYPPIEPDIGDGPTKIVVDETNLANQITLYVANGSNDIWKYIAKKNTGEAAFWEKLSGNDKPGFRVQDLAVVGSDLYALGKDGSIYKNLFDNSGWTDWYTISGAGDELKRVNSVIFGTGTKLFLSELTGSLNTENEQNRAFIIKDVDTGNRWTAIDAISGTGKLIGAVYDGATYWIGTNGGGLHKGTGSFTHDTTFGDTILGLAVHNNKVFIVTPSTIYNDSGQSLGSGTFTGAVAGWEDKSGNDLLLAGVRRGSGAFAYGYREADINGSGGFVVPGEGANSAGNLSSVKTSSQYVSAIGDHAIKYLYALPPGFGHDADNDGRPIVFASTVKDGLWSYRTRNGEAQWNGEDRTPF